MLKICKYFRPKIFKIEKCTTRRMHYTSHTRKIGVQGVPFELGQRKPGVSRGPKILRDTEFIEILQSIVGLDVKDYGDVAFEEGKYAHVTSKLEDSSQSSFQLPDFQTHKYRNHSGIRNEKEVGAACHKISETTKEIIFQGRVCLTLGGDHSIALGTISGAAQMFKRLGIIWVDAHTDINTPLSSYTGNMHGMPVSFLLKELEGKFKKSEAFNWLKPVIHANSIVYIGLRDVEPAERSILNKFGIKAFSMAEVDKYGINFITEMTLDYLCSTGDRPLHISYDVDSLDDLEIPCTGTPVPGGLSLREGMRLMEMLHQTNHVSSIDIVEFNPSLGTSSYDVERSAKAIKELIFSSFGYYRGGIPSDKTPIPIP